MCVKVLRRSRGKKMLCIRGQLKKLVVKIHLIKIILIYNLERFLIT